MKSKWNEAEQGRMLALRDKGKTYKEIAEEMGISYYSVSNFFHKQYIELHKQDPEQYSLRKQGHPVTSGKSKKELEREKGIIVNKKPVLRVMRKYDLLPEVRPISGTTHIAMCLTGTCCRGIFMQSAPTKSG